MNILKKIYPRNGAASYMSTITLVLIAEGYTAAQESQFYKDVYAILDRLGNTFPFSVLKGNINITATFFLSLKKR